MRVSAGGLLLAGIVCGALAAPRGGAQEAATPRAPEAVRPEEDQPRPEVPHGDAPRVASPDQPEEEADPPPVADEDETGDETEDGHETVEATGKGKAKPPEPVAAPEEPPCDPAKGDVCLVAERQGREEGHFWGRGFADLRAADLQIQTDSLDVRDVQTGDATEQHLTAEGNVVLLRKNERLAGDRLELNLSTGHGTMEHVVGYMEPGVFFTARHVERVDPKTFRLQKARFTSCCQPNPRWSFAASSATLKVGKHIRAANVRFDVASPVVDAKLPLVYFPYLIYPTKEDERATGLLLPSLNIDTRRGSDVRFGFFWAMGRSFDQTFSVERRPWMSYRVGHQFRWILGRGSRGTLTTMLFPPQKGAEPENRPGGLPLWNDRWDYSLQWNASQQMPLGFQAKALANITSPQDIATSSANYYSSNRRAQFSLQRRFGRQSLQLQAVNRTTYSVVKIGGENVVRTTTNRYLPQVSLSQSPTQIGKTGVMFQYSATAEKYEKVLSQGNEEDSSDAYGRLDVSPALSRPIAWSFLSIRPRVTGRYSYYEKSWILDENGNRLKEQGIVGPSLNYRYVEGRVDLDGPRLARIFNNPAKVYSDKFKHVFGPEATWILRRSSGGDKSVPGTDLNSSLLQAHEVMYGLVNQVYGRRKGPQGKPAAFELLTWRVYRKYYLDAPIRTRDPAFGSPLFGRVVAPVDPAEGEEPVREPIRYSPWGSKLSLKPLPGWSLDWTHEYNPTVKATTKMDLRATIRGAFGHLSGSWNRSAAYADESTDAEFPERSFVTANAELKLWGDKLAIGGTANYNVISQEYLSRTAYLRITAQCIGILINMTEARWRAGQGTGGWQFGFAIDLANLTTIGMDPSKAGTRGGAGAFGAGF